MEKHSTFPDISVDTEVLVKCLREVPVGETVTYEQLSALIGRDVTNGTRSTLARARDIVQREDRIVFKTVRKIGLQRSDSTQITQSGIKVVQSINRASKRGARRVACANYDELSDMDKVKHNAYQTLFAVVYEETKARNRKKLEAAVATSNKKLPFRESLKLFLTTENGT